MGRVDAQAGVIAYLSAHLDATVRATVPDPAPDRLVVVTREGGGRGSGALDAQGVGVCAFAPAEAECAELAYEVADLMEALPRSDVGFPDGYCKVVEETLMSDPDPTSEPTRPRWYGSWTVTTYRK